MATTPWSGTLRALAVHAGTRAHSSSGEYGEPLEVEEVDRPWPEPGGPVVEVGDRVTSIGEGDRVAGPFTLGDGTHTQRRNGH